MEGVSDMTLSLRLFLIIASLSLFIIVFYNIVNNKLLVKYSLLWMLLSILLIILAVFPSISFYFSNIFGFEKTSNFIFFIVFVILIMICWSYALSFSKISKNLINIVQLTSIEEKESRDKNES